MQGSVKHISALLLVIFSVFTLGNIGVTGNNQVRQSTEKHLSYFEQLSPALFIATFKKDNSAGNNSEIPVSENKISAQDLHFSTLEYSFKILIATFNRMYLQSGDYPVRYRKSDLIFPFHYFW